MPIYALGDKVPSIDPTAYVHPDAVIIGAVEIGPEASVWPCAVLRGDESAIIVGARSSVQDGSVFHCTRTLPTVVGEGCVIGHMVHMEGCTVLDGALVGNGAVVLAGATVGEGAIVGANAVVTGGQVVPPGALALGVPAKVREGAADGEEIVGSMLAYVARGRRYRDELRRIG